MPVIPPLENRVSAIASKSRASSHAFSQNVHHDNQLASDYANDRAFFELPYLELGDGVTYRMPSTYDDLAESLNLPNFLDIHVEEFYLKSTLDLESLSEMMGNDKKFGPKRHDGIGEVYHQYESLQAKLVALSVSNMDERFSLNVTEAGLCSSSVPEGAAGKIQRSIMSEGGVLQVYYVKVLEKGDGYEIIERSLPEKQIIKKSPMTIEKEEIEKIAKIWVNIARRDIQKHHKIFISFHRKQMADAKRCSETCQREVKMKVSRSLKLLRGVSIRTRKLARDMLVYWKRVDKEMAELRKKEEKEAAEALKREQELREAKRQQQRLNFLLSQTELYSHFMQNKSSSQPIDGEIPSDRTENLVTHEVKQLVEDPEEAQLKMEALKAAQDAVSKQKKITNAFDNECLKLRQDFDSEPTFQDEPVADGSSMDLLHPSTMPIASSVQTPDLFKGHLKEYQLKGLQWLVNCYEQGLNGILADEMGLGKTIQAMAFLAHLAEEKNIWGPFLVVAPASVLNNWADEISRFCPELKTLPYWGGLQERIILRKNMNPKRLYHRDAGFHILITSYQLLVSDEKYFRRVKWQYMVLDEAQAIKSANSIRWKTLLSFNCRNRLLLTGTPIQNNMAELWALLHFIMPTLFDSHEQFNEWFSKGIENHAEHGGRLNEHQLNRLHAVLKPFMLRRVKKDVISELTGKKEVTVHCELSSRQQEFYQAIKNKISLTELFDSSRGHLNEKKIMNLMNIVIQLRKVCNHPELFERNEGSTYFHFGVIPNALLPPPFGELEDVHYAGGRNPISYEIPKLVYKEFFSHSGDLLCRKPFNKYFNVFSEENIYRSSFSQEIKSNGFAHNSGRFGLTRLLDLSAAEVSFLAASSFLEKLLLSFLKRQQQELDEILDTFCEVDNICLGTRNGGAAARAVRRMLLIPSRADISFLQARFVTGHDSDPFEALVLPHRDRLISNMRILHSTYTFVPRAQAPPINAHCSDRNFSYEMMEHLHNPLIKRFMLGFARTSDHNGPWMPRGPPHPLIEEIDLNLPLLQPALQTTYGMFGTCAPMQSFDPAKLLTDSGKLRTLDVLLRRLRAENHRILLFAQMTKMLNILEDYMNYRKYRYLRLDGSSTIMDRRDMVNDFQHRNDIFVFLLSTRAGGLGINLTAADTVIFYESDWNPTLDLQAMDRAHRLGQTKEVTVYRLICKETVEEKILHRASQKSTVQELVMTGGHVQGELLAPEDVVSLLLDDPQLELKLKEMPLLFKDKQKGRRLPKPAHEEEQERQIEEEDDEEEENPAPSFEAISGEHSLQPDKFKSTSSTPRKRKAMGEKRGAQNTVNEGNSLVIETEGKPKRHKRGKKKSVNDDFDLGSMPIAGLDGGAVPE